MTTASKKRLFERSESEHPLTGLKLTVLAAVADLEIATSSHLSGMTGIGLQGVQRHVRDLFDLGLVERIGIPRSALSGSHVPNDHTLLHGRAPTIYTVSKEGKALLLDLGFREKVELPPRYGPKNTLFLAHEVEIRDVRVWLERCTRRYRHEGVSVWKTGTDAVVGKSRPDALFAYVLPGVGMVGLVELDRGTEKSPARWQEKFNYYAPVFKSGEIERKSGGFKNGRVIIITPNKERTQAICTILTRLLPDVRVPPDRFWITEKERLGSDDLSEPAWTVPGLSELNPLVSDRLLC